MNNTCGTQLTPEEFKKASRSRRLCNPGNLKFTPLTASFGAIGKDKDNFCIYPDYQTGFRALCSFLTLACENRLKAYKDCTLDQFTEIYASPPNKNYVNNVAKKLNVSPNVFIKNLL